MAFQTTFSESDTQALISQKRELEKYIEHYRDEFKKARTKIRDYKKQLRAINMKLKQGGV